MPSSAAPVPHRIVIVGGGAGGLPLATRLGERYGRRGPRAGHAGRPQRDPRVEAAAARGRRRTHGRRRARPRLSRDGALASLPLSRRVPSSGSTARAARSCSTRCSTTRASEILPPAHVPYDTLILCRRQRQQRLRRCRASPSSAISLDTLADAERFHRRLLAACVRADGRAARRRAADGEHRDHRRRRDRRRARGGDPPDHARARGLRPRPPRSGARHPAHAARGGAADPAAAAGADRDGRDASCCTSSTSTCAPASASPTVDADGVHTASGAFCPADLVVWAAGIKAPPVLADARRPRSQSRATSSSSTRRCRRRAIPTIFAFGDCAACPWLGGRKEGALLPPRAQVAHQQATLLAEEHQGAPRRQAAAGVPLPRFRLAGVAGRAVGGRHPDGPADRRQPAHPGPDRAAGCTRRSTRCTRCRSTAACAWRSTRWAASCASGSSRASSCIDARARPTDGTRKGAFRWSSLRPRPVARTRGKGDRPGTQVGYTARGTGRPHALANERRTALLRDDPADPRHRPVRQRAARRRGADERRAGAARARSCCANVPPPT